MLFGHQDDVNQPSAPATVPSVDAPAGSNGVGVNPLAVDPATGISLPVAPPVDAMPAGDNPLDEPSVLDQPSAPGYDTQPSFASDPAPTTPFGNDQATTPANTSVTRPDPTPAPVVSPAPAVVAEPVVTVTPEPARPSTDYVASSQSSSGDDLLGIKQQALSQLGPLVSHLDQTPEEKFRTTMMLIQSTDNPALLKNAYEAAQAITDEKVRAQALLDVVNEINYFTQQQSGNNS